MTLKSDSKSEEKLTLGSKNDIRNLMNFNASSGKSENLHFVVLPLLKVYYVRVKKVQRSYMSQHHNVVIRNGKRMWKHGPNRPFFLYNLSSENY